jgi:hypothetical protein
MMDMICMTFVKLMRLQPKNHDEQICVSAHKDALPHLSIPTDRSSAVAGPLSGQRE